MNVFVRGFFLRELRRRQICKVFSWSRIWSSFKQRYQPKKTGVCEVCICQCWVDVVVKEKHTCQYEIHSMLFQTLTEALTTVFSGLKYAVLILCIVQSYFIEKSVRNLCFQSGSCRMFWLYENCYIHAIEIISNGLWTIGEP